GSAARQVRLHPTTANPRVAAEKLGGPDLLCRQPWSAAQTSAEQRQNATPTSRILQTCSDYTHRSAGNAAKCSAASIRALSPISGGAIIDVVGRRAQPKWIRIRSWVAACVGIQVQPTRITNRIFLREAARF